MTDSKKTSYSTIFEAILDTLADCVITINTSSVILSANHMVEKIFGYKPE